MGNKERAVLFMLVMTIVVLLLPTMRELLAAAARPVQDEVTPRLRAHEPKLRYA